MKIAYLILVHNTPRHLNRLISALSSNSSGIFIHVDKKADIHEYRALTGTDINICKKRIPIFWGDFSVVEAILILLRSALDDRRCFERFVLLSGADYPLRSKSHIEQFFECNDDKEFIELVSMPNTQIDKPISRLTSYELRPGTPAIKKMTCKVLMKAGIMPKERDYRIYFKHLVPYGGAMWWALSREACEYTIAFVIAHTKIVNFFKNTICPDEMFFQTILGNSHFKLKATKSLTYADWSAGGSHPAYINEEHLDIIKSKLALTCNGVTGQELLFARKFSDDSADAVVCFDRMIAEESSKV